MNEFRYDPQTGAPLIPAPEKESYSTLEIFGAWCSLAVGYGFCRVFPVIAHPFGGLLMILALYAGALILWRYKKASLSLMPALLGGSALLMIPALFLSANTTLHFFAYNYALAVWFFLIYGLNGNLIKTGFSELFLFDFIKALFLLPFASLGKMIPALLSGKSKGRGILWKILLGLVIAIVPTAIVLALLSYDRAFVSLFRKIFSLDWEILFSHVFSFAFGIPVGMYFYGLFFSANRQKCKEKLTEEQCKNLSSAVQKLPELTSVAASVPILMIYLLFFASQWDYYISAFTGSLPAALSYAEYARSGFFQLCAVSVINLLIVVMIHAFVRRKGERPSLLIRVLSLIFSGSTLILITTAFAKLYLYVKEYGLTPKRVYAGWFMVILTVVFVLIIIKQLMKRFKLLPTAAMACIGLFAVLALSGSDAWIARYNVERYLKGTLETVDIGAMRELGDAAVPAMVELGKTLASEKGKDLSEFDYEGCGETYAEVIEYLYSMAQLNDHGVFDRTLPGILAESALSSAGIEGGHPVIDYDILNQ